MLDRVTIERMVAWTGDKPVLLALSGGGDSVALLHLLTAELGAPRLRAVVVDHALRDGSRDDAKRAAGFASALGVRADILTLRWEESANRAQQAAREERYKAICEHARAAGLNTLVVAHTADDQAETVLMRAANGSTWRGLAGIAPFAFAPVWPEGRGIALARPMLSARREALRVYLREQRAEWIEDPANTNPKFERVRVRARLAELEAGGFDPMRLVRIAARLRRRSDALDAAALSLISRAVEVGVSTTILRDAWDAPCDVRARVLSALMAAAAGSSREPSWTDMPRLEATIMAWPHGGATHSGVDFSSTQTGVTLLRDLGASIGRADGAPPLSPLRLGEGVEAVWDGRLAVTALEPGWRVVPARNKYRFAFENGSVRRSYEQMQGRFRLRALAAERIAHAFAPDINRAKP
ncbi:MAG: tRNA lysidine(34) synthetase TilS [Hyphomonadaceae bacterium]